LTFDRYFSRFLRLPT